MEAKIFDLIILLYSLTTFLGVVMLFMPCMVEHVHTFKKWLASKVNYNNALYVIALSTLFMIYGVTFAWLVISLFIVSMVVWCVVTFIKSFCKMPQPENTNNMEIHVAEEV